MSEDDRQTFKGTSPSPGRVVSKPLSLDLTSAGTARASAQSQKATSTGRVKCIISVQCVNGYAVPFTASLKDHPPIVLKECERAREEESRCSGGGDSTSTCHVFKLPRLKLVTTAQHHLSIEPRFRPARVWSKPTSDSQALVMELIMIPWSQGLSIFIRGPTRVR